MRCMALASVLSGKGAVVLFISRSLNGNYNQYLARNGCRVLTLSGESLFDVIDHEAHIKWQDDAAEVIAALNGDKHCGNIDWLVVDHYGLDRRWESRLRSHVKRILVIDDLANRHHDCDLLLDQTPVENENKETRYDRLVPAGCRQLMGPAYALLREEFQVARENLCERDGTVRKILVFFGGADPTDETSKAINAIRMLERPDISVDVVVGLANPRRDEVREACLDSAHINYHCQVDNMARLMAAADLFIGAGGTTSLERCYLGLPSITLVTAANQERLTRAVASRGAAVNMGWMKDVSDMDIFHVLEKLVHNPQKLRAMGEAALGIAGAGRSGSEKVAQIMLENSADER